MTNHSEAIEPSGQDRTADTDAAIPAGPPRPAGSARSSVPAGSGQRPGEGGPGPRPGTEQITLRSPAELADALPYLLGYRPEESIVLVAVHDREGRGRFGGRARLGIPEREEDWPSVARQLAHCLIGGSERRGRKPEGMVAFLCLAPKEGESGRQVMERLKPLAHHLRIACGGLDVPVVEALCVSAGRFWSYCCPGGECCPADGVPMGFPGTSVLAAAATYAGLQVRGSLKDFRARLTPWESMAARDQETALDNAGGELVPRILDESSRAEVATLTLDLGQLLMRRLASAEQVPGRLEADLRDDGLIAHDEAAALIVGLQDRTTRDCAAAWMEGEEAAAALRLWRALARRCVGPYIEYSAAPLTLVGWVAWSCGDELEAREALAMALGADEHYTFARLLHQACNEGLDPEPIRRCLRKERAERTDRTQQSVQDVAGRTAVRSRPANARHPAPPGRRAPSRAGRTPGTPGPRPGGPASRTMTKGTGRRPGPQRPTPPRAPRNEP